MIHIKRSITSINNLLISTFYFKVKLPLEQQPLILKCLFERNSHYTIFKHSYKQQRNYITSFGTRINLINTHNSFILSKTMSGQGDQNQNVNYFDIVEAQKDESVLIIDVREDFEIQETGKLPGSIHIPMDQVTNVLTNLTNQEFEEKFNRKKPAENSKIVLSCRAGRRSEKIQSDIQKLGFKNVHNYAGGWLDWQSHQKNFNV